jgi:hypothetical protein
VVLSVAAGYRGDLQRQLRELRSLLPEAVRVAVGGAGSSQTSAGDYRLNGFDQLLSWTKELLLAI